MVQDTLAITAKETLMGFAKEMDSRLEQYWDSEINNNFGFNETQKILVRKMLLHAKEHNLRPAKRVRAAFVMYGYLLGQKNQKLEMVDERVWRAAEAVEIIHTALLMHDDFMDQDKVRRGLPTTQVFFGEMDGHYGDSMAVNTGDALLCLGYERLLTCGFEPDRVQRAMKQLFRGIANTAFGQAYDMSLPKLGELTEEKVMSLHAAKTAIYTYENPLFIGAILADLSQEVLEVLHDYSMSGGVGFQLQDDVLGVFGDEEKTGKSVDSDLLQGKVTLLIVKVMKDGTQEQKDIVQKLWGKLVANKGDIELAKKAIVDSGSCEYSVEVAKRMSQEAANLTTKLRGLGLNDEAVDYLEGIERYMVEREV